MGDKGGHVQPGIFDAHCDTVMKVLDHGVDFMARDVESHISFPGLIESGVRAQIFACFVLSERYPGSERARALEMIEAVGEMAAATDGQLRMVTSQEDLEAAFGGGPIAGILALEGADPLESDADNLRLFYERGVRSVIPAWQDNAFSGTAFGTNTPLTDQGRQLISLCEELGVMVDVSHLSDRAFADVVALAGRPFVASHSNCRALCPTARNLTDEMIRSLANAGGVMGINFSPSFLCPDTRAAVMPLFEAARKPGVSEAEQAELHQRALAVPRPSLSWVVRHVQHAIQVGGEDCIGFGADLDGIGALPDGFEGVSDFAKFPELLDRAGLRTGQIEKVCFRNFVRVFGEVLKDG